MKAKQPIRYRLSISRTFPAKHPKAGQETNFEPKILLAKMRQNHRGTVINAEKNGVLLEPKLHTIRGNYQLWKKRFEKIDKGEAVLELYYWTGKPYNSACKTFVTLTKEDGIGLQKIELDPFGLNYRIDDKELIFNNGNTLSQNDGLSPEDFKAWFKGCDLSEPLAIIHFTKFRY